MRHLLSTECSPLPISAPLLQPAEMKVQFKVASGTELCDLMEPCRNVTSLGDIAALAEALDVLKWARAIWLARIQTDWGPVHSASSICSSDNICRGGSCRRAGSFSYLRFWSHYGSSEGSESCKVSNAGCCQLVSVRLSCCKVYRSAGHHLLQSRRLMTQEESSFVQSYGQVLQPILLHAFRLQLRSSAGILAALQQQLWQQLPLQLQDSLVTYSLSPEAYLKGSAGKLFSTPGQCTADPAQILTSM